MEAALSNPVAEQFSRVISFVFDETFEQTHGIYLDRGTSLFETLAAITAQEASRPLGLASGTIAAKVEHVRFYLDVLADYMQGRKERVDWGEIWRTVAVVTPEEWAASQARLKASHQRVLQLVNESAGWESEDAMSGALGILVHTAYHLGEIRQALSQIG